MARWGTMTERGTFTMTEQHRKRLRTVANETKKSESKIVRDALDMLFEHLEAQKRGDLSTAAGGHD